MTKFISIAAVALAALAFASISPAIAKGHGWKSAGGNLPGFSHGQKIGWRSAGVPPGWSHGRKTGWKGASTPPGWSKNDQ
jgi:hypothetical protein